MNDHDQTESVITIDRNSQVCDEMDFGCMVAAERLGIPHATMLVIASGLLTTHNLLAESLNDLHAEHGLLCDPDLTMLSRFLVLSPFPASFRDPGSPLPATAHAFRAAVPVADASPAWLSSLPDRLTIYVTLGTVFNVESGNLFHRLLKGLRSLPVNLVVTVGPQITPAELGSVEIHRELMMADPRWIMAAKLVSVLSLRMEIRNRGRSVGGC